VPTWDVTRHQVALSGRVVDAQTKQPLAGALVELATMPAAVRKWLDVRTREAESLGKPAPGAQRTGRDGAFRFVDLPAGSYALAVSHPQAGTRYGTAKPSAKLVAASGGGVTPVVLEVALVPTAVRGTVTGPGGDPVVMAEVALKGGESTYTDDRGDYVLSAVEAGARTLLVRAHGMAPATAAVPLSAGAKAAVVDVALTRA
jgi:hypothetical protein